jgi:hypothetical protein
VLIKKGHIDATCGFMASTNVSLPDQAGPHRAGMIEPGLDPSRMLGNTVVEQLNIVSSIVVPLHC